jgi:pimeloyl-ACP methyl ester carboxylesterase
MKNPWFQKLESGIHEWILPEGPAGYIYFPPSVASNTAGAKILVSVHGYSGRTHDKRGKDRVRKATERWVVLAEEERWIVLAPHFTERWFGKEWQRLGFSGRRTDTHLLGLIRDLGESIPGLITKRFLLFGFSAGGQFVHRFAAFHPDRVLRAVAAAPGWYLWPDRGLPYPLGIGPGSLPGGHNTQLARFCQKPILIVVGENDNEQGAYRRHYKGYNLDSLQGKGRLKRSKYWIHAMTTYAYKNHFPLKIVHRIVPDTKHTISKRLLKISGEFLAENRKKPTKKISSTARLKT